MMRVAPISAIIATRNRAASLARTLNSLLEQEIGPSELIVVDASESALSKDIVDKLGAREGNSIAVKWRAAEARGAAAQRNEGVALSTQPIIWFFDDDVTFEPGCLERLWNAMNSDPQLGGANAMIINQRYQSPGAISRLVFTLMNGQSEESFAGKVIGPAVNLLPEDRDDLPDIVPVEWLNTTCAIYRRAALPAPAFDSFFTGYSLMEDVTLSLRVSQSGWKLANIRRARVFHDSQPGEHKSDVRESARMELVNRYHVMTSVLHQRGLLPIFRLGLWQLFQIISVAARSSTRRNTIPMLLGELDAAKAIVSRRQP